jgi:glycosyltransferase involved in cell wall biosynthesis
MTEPLAGIIIPCFNQGRFAAECVAGIREQSWRNWRAVIVNDASTDDSAALLDSLAGERIEVVHLRRNLGRALVRNEAVRRLGKVDYVLNVDCDDRLTPPYLEQLVHALETDATAGLAYGTLRYFGDVRAGETWPTEPYDHAGRFLDDNIPGPGALFRTRALAETYGWREEFTDVGGEDWDLWLQVVEHGWKPVWVREAIYEYRQHAASFLARSSSDTRVNQEVTLLGLHARSIRESCGFDEFLAPRVIPDLAAAIRSGRFGRVVHLARPLLRHAPASTIKLLARHYGQRLRGILSRR